MHAAEFPKWSVVYLDLEEGILPTGAYQDYVLAWKDSVDEAGYFPAIYCTGNVLRWSLEHAKVVWLARPQNVDRNGNIVPQVVDPDHLPAGSPEPNTIATQALFEVEFQGLDQPREDGHAPRFDLSCCAVADPSDLASVDEALQILPGSKPRDEEAVA
jgi:hypothetical protein